MSAESPSEFCTFPRWFTLSSVLFSLPAAISLYLATRVVPYCICIVDLMPLSPPAAVVALPIRFGDHKIGDPTCMVVQVSQTHFSFCTLLAGLHFAGHFRFPALSQAGRAPLFFFFLSFSELQ